MRCTGVYRRRRHQQACMHGPFDASRVGTWQRVRERVRDRRKGPDMRDADAAPSSADAAPSSADAVDEGTAPAARGESEASASMGHHGKHGHACRAGRWGGGAQCDLGLSTFGPSRVKRVGLVLRGL